MPTIGQKLEETRISRGLSIEDVAHRTRIHPNVLLHIEEDDFSHFPSVAYAKGFIRKYGHHLGLDLGDAMESLNVGVTRIGENELMGEMKRTIHKDRLFHLERTPRLFRRRRPARRGSPLFLNFVLATLMAALGLFYFLGYNAPSAQKAKEEITRGIARGIGIDLAPGSGEKTVVPGTTHGLEVASPPSAAVADTSPAPETPEPEKVGSPSEYPSMKEVVDLKFDDELSLPPKNARPRTAAPDNAIPALPRPRETPRLVVSENPVPAPGYGRPSGTAHRVEPQPALRPSGTNPPSPGTEEPPGSLPRAVPVTGTR